MKQTYGDLDSAIQGTRVIIRPLAQTKQDWSGENATRHVSLLFLCGTCVRAPSGELGLSVPTDVALPKKQTGR